MGMSHLHMHLAVSGDACKELAEVIGKISV